MIAIRGAASAIVAALRPLLSDDVVDVRRDAPMPVVADRYLFCAGLLRPTRVADQAEDEIRDSFWANAGAVMQACDRILLANARARICVIGSHSGEAGSFDATYAAAKAGLHRYIETTRLPSPDQQLVGIAPGIIGDADMTLRRTDVVGLQARREAHPKRRFLFACEVARLVHFLLYVDEGYLTGTVIRMHGGLV